MELTVIHARLVEVGTKALGGLGAKSTRERKATPPRRVALAAVPHVGDYVRLAPHPNELPPGHAATLHFEVVAVVHDLAQLDEHGGLPGGTDAQAITLFVESSSSGWSDDE